MSDLVEVVKKNKNVIMYLNRPEVYNAFNYELFVALGEQLEITAMEKDVFGIIITGRGKAFSGGGDLKSIAEYSGGMDAALHRLVPQLNKCIVEIAHMDKPVVAAINGMAAGGGFSLALACDFRFMAQSAKLKQAYTSSGLSIDGAGTQNLPRLVGYSKALEIAAFDEIITSEKAKSWGLVTKVVHDEELISEALIFLNQFAGRSMNSFAWSKKLFLASYSNSLEQQLELERESIVSCVQRDGEEGINAFIEKRKPNF